MWKYEMAYQCLYNFVAFREISQLPIVEWQLQFYRSCLWRLLYRYHITPVFSLILGFLWTLKTGYPQQQFTEYKYLSGISHKWKLYSHDQQKLKILLWKFESYCFNRQKVENLHFHFFTFNFSFTRIFLSHDLTLGHILPTIPKLLWFSKKCVANENTYSSVPNNPTSPRILLLI